MRKSGIFVLLFIFSFGTILCGNPVTVSRKAIAEAVELAAKRGGKALTPAARIAAEKAAAKAFAKYGDDVLKGLSKGGMEALRQGAKYGDDFWRLCAHGTPEAARSLALHADDLMPVAKRLGVSFMELESKAPGLAKRIVSTFGDDAAKTLAKAPANDLSRLLGYAGKADSPATVKYLYSSYQKTGGKILQWLDWKKVMAVGLSIAVIDLAHQTGSGVRHAAEKHPEMMLEAVTDPVKYLLYGLGTLLLIPIGYKVFLRCRRKKQSC